MSIRIKVRLQKAQHLDLPQGLSQATATPLRLCPQAIPQDRGCNPSQDLCG
jgi:hypothetical protein